MATAEPYQLGRSTLRKFRLTVPESVRRARWYDKAALGAAIFITLLALFGPLLAAHGPLDQVTGPFQSPGSHGLLFGSDELGRDILTRVLFGIRSTWFSALAVVASGVVIGAVVGLVAGATGGIVDNVLMRITDLFLALPGPVLAIAVVSALGPSLFHTLIALAITWWPLYARVTRGEVNALKARPHLEAARLAGASRWRRATRHLLPGAIPALVVTASLDIGLLIITLSGLSFLGLGEPAPAPELGAMTARGFTYLLQYWWIPIVPGIAVAVLALVANIAGDSIRDILEER